MATTKEHIINALQTPTITVFLATSLLLLFLPLSVWDSLVFVVWFSAFDVIGYHYILCRSADGNTTLEAEAYYRIFQHVILFAGSGLLSLHIGWYCGLLVLFLWWCGVCDILYYVLLQERFFGHARMYWLEWTLPYFLVRSSSSLTIALGSGIATAIVFSILIYIQFYCK